jgi:hypothetical protein
LRTAACRVSTPTPAGDIRRRRGDVNRNAQFRCRNKSFVALQQQPATGASDADYRNHCLTFPRYLGVVADMYRVPRQLVKAMQSIEIADPKVARRARFAQLRGEKVTLNFKGSTITGLVRSVKEDATSTPPRWIVTVVGMRAVAA